MPRRRPHCQERWMPALYLILRVIHEPFKSRAAARTCRLFGYCADGGEERPGRWVVSRRTPCTAIDGGCLPLRHPARLPRVGSALLSMPHRFRALLSPARAKKKQRAPVQTRERPRAAGSTHRASRLSAALRVQEAAPRSAPASARAQQARLLSFRNCRCDRVYCPTKFSQPRSPGFYRADSDQTPCSLAPTRLARARSRQLA